MTTDGLQTRHRRTDHSIQFAIGIVIAVAAVLGIEYGLQQITWTPPPASGILSRIDPAAPASPSDEETVTRHSDQPGYARVQDARPVEQAAAPRRDSRPTADVRYFPVRGEAPADSQFAELEQPGFLHPESAPADHSDSNGPSSPTPSRLAAPVSGHATPIHHGTNSHDDHILSIIRQELPLASDEEHQIWLNALRGLAPHTVRQLLRLRQVIGAETPARVAGSPHCPDKHRPLGPTENKPVFPELFASCKPVAEQWMTAGNRTVGGAELSAQLVSECLHPAQESIRLACQVVLGNIANANTIGFKRRRVFFENLVGDRERGRETAGSGVQVSEIQSDHSPGPLRTTRGPLDLAIDGDGFFQIQAGSEILYTRAGNFRRNADGELVIRSGDRDRPLEPTITIPRDATRIVIADDGTVSVRQPLVPDLTEVGQIQTARFINPQGLLPRGENLYEITAASGQPYSGNPGSGGRGKLRQFCLEQSNVRLKDELQSLARLQRQILAIRQAALILSSSGDVDSPRGDGSPGPLVRQPASPAEPDGPKLSRQPAPQNR